MKAKKNKRVIGLHGVGVGESNSEDNIFSSVASKKEQNRPLRQPANRRRLTFPARNDLAKV